MRNHPRDHDRRPEPSGHGFWLHCISHDLANAIHPIVLRAALLEETGAVTDDSLRAGLRAIVADARRLQRFVRDLSDLPRIQDGRLSMELRPTDLGATVRRTLDALSPVLDQHGVRLDLDASDGVLVSADAERLDQVVANLVVNAARFSPRGGTLHVRTGVHGARAVVHVRDQGPGITPEDAGRLFRPYSRLHADDPHRGGVGLGLYIAQHIVLEHGGAIDVDSGGGGTTFSFWLPLLANT